MADKENEPTQSIQVHNIKNLNFKTVYSDGVQSTITPTGKVNLNFYLQRLPIPKTINYEIDKVKGGLGEIIGSSNDSLEGIVREFEVGVLMDYHSILALRDNISKIIEDFQIIVNNISK